MRKKFSVIFLLASVALGIISFKNTNAPDTYVSTYNQHLHDIRFGQLALLAAIDKAELTSETGLQSIKQQIDANRCKLKAADFWLRYLEPTVYKKLNGPLPVEWETEVFEKFEKPYKREGAGLTLAALYLEEEHIDKQTLRSLIQQSADAMATYNADSITKHLTSYHHFYLCNRLYLLNLAAIYTTGFECPDTAAIIPELRQMMADVKDIYAAFDQSFPDNALSKDYLALYNKAIQFVNAQSPDYTVFDHFSFIKDYVNPLFLMNQQMINSNKVVTRSLIDYALNKKEITIFSKELYNGQNTKGIFHRVVDTAAMKLVEQLGKLLFYDPILSANNQRSCASCHKPTEFFTDNKVPTPLQFNRADHLPRNTPSLLNAQYNHLLMLDGKHFTLQHQSKDVITNSREMSGKEEDILKKVLSCREYSKGFNELLKYTPTETEVTMEHISSAITFYYSKFSRYYAPFDRAINEHAPIAANVKTGFNLFMGKAQCATCHFVPQFNGVKPPYIGSEFEVLGVPADTGFKALSPDKGRYGINPADETLNAFRTGTLRNSEYTAPYMHNGVFNTLEQVIDFYDAGGGAGRGLKVANQTLSSDSLRLSKLDKTNLVAFIKSLNEDIPFEGAPATLPKSKIKALNNRKPGGEY